MNRRVVAGWVVTVALLAGCSDDGDTALDAAAGSTITEPATTGSPAGTPAGPQVVLRSEFASDAAALQAGAEVLQNALERQGVADARVSVDSDRLVVSSVDPDLRSTVESVISGTVSVHPVLACSADDATTGTDAATADQWLPLASGEQCQVGPAAASETVFLPTAVPAIIGGGWSVNAQLRPGADGVDAFNSVAASCFEMTAMCPSGRLAIVVDGRIITAPTVNIPTFAAEVQISGDFAEAEVADIASMINVAALALTLDPA